MNQRGNIALYVGLAVVGVVLVLGAGVGIRYYNQKQEKPALENKQTQSSQQPKLEESKPVLTENIYRPGEMWRETKLPNGNTVFIKDHNLYIHNPSSGDVLITENTPKSLGLPPANYKVTLDEWFGEDPVLLTSDFYGFITISKEQDKFAFVYKRLQKDAITKDSGFYPYSTLSKLLLYSLDGKSSTTYELDKKKFSLNYELSYFDKEKVVFEGATTKGPLPTITYFLGSGKTIEEEF